MTRRAVFGFTPAAAAAAAGLVGPVAATVARRRVAAVLVLIGTVNINQPPAVKRSFQKSVSGDPTGLD
jgi:hypothetical protein